MDGKKYIKNCVSPIGQTQGYALLNIAGLAVGMASCHPLCFGDAGFEAIADKGFSGDRKRLSPL